MELMTRIVDGLERLKKAGISKNDKRRIMTMILANIDKLTIKIRYTKDSGSLVFLYFTGDTFPHRESFKKLGFVHNYVDRGDKV